MKCHTMKQEEKGFGENGRSHMGGGEEKEKPILLDTSQKAGTTTWRILHLSGM